MGSNTVEAWIIEVNFLPLITGIIIDCFFPVLLAFEIND